MFKINNLNQSIGITMRNTKTKIKFTDIVGMLERDEMKEVVGGSGTTTGSGGGTVFLSGTALGGNFQGGVVSQSSFNGVGYTYGSGGASSGIPNNTSGSTSATSTWTIDANGNYSTTNSADIARFTEMMKDPYSISNHSITDISSFIKGEMAIMDQITTLYGTLGQTGINDAAAIKALQLQNYTQLKEVIVTKGYSKVASLFDTNWGNYDIYTNSSNNDVFKLFSGNGGSIGSSPSFKMDSNYEVLYPKFTNTVKNIAYYATTNPKILSTLKQFTGLSSEQIYEKLQYGQGPTVSVSQLNNAYGYHNPLTNTVQIDVDYVNQLEASTGSKADLLNLMLSITLLHEFVHWTDGLFFNYTQENGNNWEIATYGFVVNMGNVSVVKQP